MHLLSVVVCAAAVAGEQPLQHLQQLQSDLERELTHSERIEKLGYNAWQTRNDKPWPVPARTQPKPQPQPGVDTNTFNPFDAITDQISDLLDPFTPFQLPSFATKVAPPVYTPQVNTKVWNDQPEPAPKLPVIAESDMEAEASSSLAAGERQEALDAAFGADKGKAGHRRRLIAPSKHAAAEGGAEEEEEERVSHHNKHGKGATTSEGEQPHHMSMSNTPWRGCTPSKKHKIHDIKIPAATRCCLNDNHQSSDNQWYYIPNKQRRKGQTAGGNWFRCSDDCQFSLNPFSSRTCSVGSGEVATSEQCQQQCRHKVTEDTRRVLKNAEWAVQHGEFESDFDLLTK